MSHIPQALHDAFPQASGALQALKIGNAHFQALAEQFDALDTEAAHIEAGEEPASDARLEEIKKHRLAILDEIATLVANAEATGK